MNCVEFGFDRSRGFGSARGQFWPTAIDRPTRSYNIASTAVQQAIIAHEACHELDLCEGSFSATINNINCRATEIEAIVNRKPTTVNASSVAFEVIYDFAAGRFHSRPFGFSCSIGSGLARSSSLNPPDCNSFPVYFTWFVKLLI
jgi:hypothetical protein